ncbi:MAG: GNAT family N-acetyltransferase [Clostridiales bacterium]|nr:GNAT family N-acetyltransferase [Clostridiales bacterium]
MSSRLDTLRAVNHMEQEDGFSEELMSRTAKYLRTGDQTTVLAMDGDVIGCATICYIDVMPTPGHPSGKRAHVMNVHVREEYQRQGIARRMMEMLIAEAKERGVTEITLDATDEGRPLYEKCGFAASDECMFLDVK